MIKLNYIKYYLFIFSILLLNTLLFFIKKETFINNEERYRLGDMIRFKIQRKKDNGYKYHSTNFPNSIAVQYMNTTDKENDMDTLLKIINKNTNNNHLKYKDYIVLHLRTGDIIESKTHNKNKKGKDFLSYKINKYVNPISYYENILNELKKYTNLKNILIISGFHSKGNHKESLEYINGIEDFFKRKNYIIEKRINQDPDDDFLIMCNSKYFIKSGGGFSNIISKIVNKKKNKVFE